MIEDIQVGHQLYTYSFRNTKIFDRWPSNVHLRHFEELIPILKLWNRARTVVLISKSSSETVVSASAKRALFGNWYPRPTTRPSSRKQRPPPCTILQPFGWPTEDIWPIRNLLNIDKRHDKDKQVTKIRHKGEGWKYYCSISEWMALGNTYHVQINPTLCWWDNCIFWRKRPLVSCCTFFKLHPASYVLRIRGHILPQINR